MLLRPEKNWYLTELAAFLHKQPSSLQREMDALSRAGILKQWRDGRRVYVKPNTDSPVFSDLRSLFEKTVGIVSVLQQELKTFGDRIPLAFLYGSIARSEERSESDVDLMVVGSVGLSELVPLLRRSERTLGRQVNPTVFSSKEFVRKLRNEDHFISTVLQDAKLFVKGSEHELEAMAGRRRHPSA
ncbi:MAG TPA: nucleotidyltransferase domain-containing protein [Acidobacteriaceae bacterium]